MKNEELEQLEHLLLAYIDSYEFIETVVECMGYYLDIGDLIDYILGDIKRRRSGK